MRRYFLGVILLLQGSGHPAGALAVADPRDGSLTPGRLLGAVLAVAGAIGFARVLSWVWTDGARPLLDAFVVRAVRRERATFEEYLRVEVFQADLAAAQTRQHMTEDAHRIATACEESLAEIRGDIAGIPRIVEAVERMATSTERLEASVGRVREDVARQAGTLETMQRSKKWDGSERRA